MGLLSEIQKSLMNQGGDLGTILLKLRFLASRLGSNLLDEWVRFESEGYPSNVDVPEYRIVPVIYTATFSGPFGSGIKNAQIPEYVIDRLAGGSWSKFSVRESISSIDNLIDGGGEGGRFHVNNASNLIGALQGRVYKNYSCIGVTGELSSASLAQIQSIVRTKILDFTIELERSVPAAADIVLESDQRKSSGAADDVTRITQHIINGNVTNINNSGKGNKFNVISHKGDGRAFIEGLVAGGISENDAEELSSIVRSEESSGNQGEPFGPRAQEWIANNIHKAASGIWKVGISVATQLLTEAGMRYYGFK